VLLYKGPDVEQEIADARKLRARIQVIMRYELPESMGARTIVEISL